MRDIFTDSIPDIPDFLIRRRLNEDGLSLIKEYEGLRLKAYKCPSNVWTIGYGHTRSVYPYMEITESQAEDLLDQDVRRFEKAVSRLVKVPLNENEYSALVCFVFNVGIRNFEKSSLLRLLNRGWYEQVPVQLLRWNKSKGEILGGLNRRRIAEGRLWKRSV